MGTGIMVYGLKGANAKAKASIRSAMRNVINIEKIISMR